MKEQVANKIVVRVERVVAHPDAFPQVAGAAYSLG
jgi:hypothetical protein